MNFYQRLFWQFVAVISGLFSLTAAANDACNAAEPGSDKDAYEVSGQCDLALNPNITSALLWENCIRDSHCPVLTVRNEDQFCRIQLPDGTLAGLKEDGNITVLACYYGLHDEPYISAIQQYLSDDRYYSTVAVWRRTKKDGSRELVSRIKADNNTLSVTDKNLENLNAYLLTDHFSCYHFWYINNRGLGVSSNEVPFTPAQTLSLKTLREIHTPDHRTVLHWQVLNKGMKNGTLTLQLPNVNWTWPIDADDMDDADRVQDGFLDITGSDSVSAYIECGIKKGLTEKNTNLADASALFELPAWVPLWNATDCNSSHTSDANWQLSPVAYNAPLPVVSCGLGRNDSCNPDSLQRPLLQLLVNQSDNSAIIDMDMPKAYILLSSLNVTTDKLAYNETQLYCRFTQDNSDQNWIAVLHDFRPTEQPSTASSGATSSGATSPKATSSGTTTSEAVQNVLPRLMLLSSLLVVLILMP